MAGIEKGCSYLYTILVKMIEKYIHVGRYLIIPLFFSIMKVEANGY